MAAGAEEGIAGHAVVCQVTADADARITLAADIAGADGKVTGVLVAVGKFAVFVGCDVGDAFDGLTLPLVMLGSYSGFSAQFPH